MPYRGPDSSADPPAERSPDVGPLDGPARARSLWLALTFVCVTALSAWVLRLPSADRAWIRAQQAAPAGEVPAPESGHLRRHREGRRAGGRRSGSTAAPAARAR